HCVCNVVNIAVTIHVPASQPVGKLVAPVQALQIPVSSGKPEDPQPGRRIVELDHRRQKVSLPIDELSNPRVFTLLPVYEESPLRTANKQIREAGFVYVVSANRITRAVEVMFTINRRDSLTRRARIQEINGRA